MIVASMLNKGGQNLFDGADILRMDEPAATAQVSWPLWRWRPTAKASEQRAPARTDLTAPALDQFAQRAHNLFDLLTVNQQWKTLWDVQWFYLILEVGINIFSAQNVLERFEQRLVEMKVTGLRLFLQNVADNAAQDFYRSLGDGRIITASRLNNKM